jgi:hypothetical protein
MVTINKVFRKKSKTNFQSLKQNLIKFLNPLNGLKSTFKAWNKAQLKFIDLQIGGNKISMLKTRAQLGFIGVFMLRCTIQD